MVRIIIFLISAMCGYLHSAGQNAKIQIDITDVCSTPTTLDIIADLYVLNGNDSLHIQSTTSNPFIFENLNQNFTYFVKLKLPVGTKNYGIKDAAILYDKLVSNDISREIMNAGDFNENGAITTLDFVALMNDIAGTNTIQPYYILILSNTENNITQLNNEGTLFRIDGIKGENQILDLTLLQKGHISNADENQCSVNCISNSAGKLYLVDNYVKPNEKVIVPLFTKSTENMYGFDIQLNYEGMVLDSVINSSTSYFTHDETKKNIHYVWIKNDLNPSQDTTLIKLGELEFTSKQLGRISDIIRLTTSNNTALIKSDSCYITVPSVDLVFDESSQNCIIQWPPSVVRIPDCSGLYHTGTPIINSECDEFYYVYKKDTHLSNSCTVIREWTGFNYISLEEEKYLQVIKQDSTFQHICKNQVIVNIATNDVQIHAKELLTNYFDNHNYSFSSEIKDSLITLAYSLPYTEEKIVYDLTTDQLCITQILKNKIVDTSGVHVKPHIVVPLVNNVYKVHARSFLGAVLPLDLMPASIQISEDGIKFYSSIDYDKSQKGSTQSFILRFNIGGILYNYGTVTALLQTFTSPPPLVLYAFNDIIEQDKPATINVYAKNFNDLIGAQMGIRFVDCTLSTVTDQALDVEFNYDTQWNFCRLLWTSRNLAPTSLDSNQVLFSLEIMPNATNNVENFLAIDPSVMAPEAIFDDLFTQDTLELLFEFPQRPIINHTMDFLKDVNFFPNPSMSGNFTLELPNDEPILTSNLYNSQGVEIPVSLTNLNLGKYLVQCQQNIPNGLYFLHIRTDKRLINQKVLVIK
ncbi:MAG: T9SS type A sorting domain-containing protein [Saprospiraceae bacterium]